MSKEEIVGDGKETSFPVKLSERGKRRRSKRDELKDWLIEDIERRIDGIQSDRIKRERINDMDAHMISILRDQIRTINKLCEKKE